VSVRLSRDEAWEVLETAHTGVLTTLKADGTPIALPVWFVALERCVYVATPEHTRKVARVARDPRVSFLVESGERWADLLGVHLTGEARVVTDPNLIGRVREALDAKYAAFRPETRRPEALLITVLELVPDDRILTWDNGRLKQHRSAEPGRP
jgi:PPOX class probable F420-dependent enzyme